MLTNNLGLLLRIVTFTEHIVVKLFLVEMSSIEDKDHIGKKNLFDSYLKCLHNHLKTCRRIILQQIQKKQTKKNDMFYLPLCFQCLTQWNGQSCLNTRRKQSSLQLHRIQHGSGLLVFF